MPVKRTSKLDRLGPKLENAVKRGLILSGQLVAQRASGIAPIDTGRLKRSITHSLPQQIAANAWRVDVGANVEYAPYQEFGTRFMPGKPYLRPSLKKSRAAIKKLIKSNVAAALKQ